MTSNIYTDGTYFSNHPTWDQEDSPWKAQKIIKMIEKHNIQFSSYVEIGCGAGGILHILANLYPKAKFHGYDISPRAIQMAKKNEDANVEFFCEDILAKNHPRYDIAALIDVVEHIEDYVFFLKNITKIASKFIFVFPLDISVSNVIRNIIHGGNCGHLHYFLKDTALQILHHTGYKVVDYFYAEAGLERLSKRRQRLAYLPRKLLYSINQDLCVRILGGFPLLILAEPVMKR